MLTPGPPPSPMARLGLRQVQGEAPGEIVYMASWRSHSFWIKHEFPAAPWEWIIVDGRFPVDFGTEPTQAEAAARLEDVIRELLPEYGQERMGLLDRVRALVGL